MLYEELNHEGTKDTKEEEEEEYIKSHSISKFVKDLRQYTLHYTLPIEWADIIFVMEKSHKINLSKNFQPFLKDKRIICLDIPDEYEYMQPELGKLLKCKVLPLLNINQ